MSLMNNIPVSYEFARDMADLANTAHSAMLNAHEVVDTATTDQHIAGVARNAGSLAVLQKEYQLATNDFNYLDSVVPDFRNGEVSEDSSDSGVTVAELTDPEALTPEEIKYKIEALKGLEASFESYREVLVAINEARDGNNQIPIADAKDIRRAFEAALTPAMIRAEMASIADYDAAAVIEGTAACFDTVFVPNVDITDRDIETSKKHFEPSPNKKFGWGIDIHYRTVIAHHNNGSDAKVQAVRVPRHFNIAQVSGAGLDNIQIGRNFDEKRAKTVNANNLNPDIPYTLEVVSEIVEVAHAALLKSKGDYGAKHTWEEGHLPPVSQTQIVTGDYYKGYPPYPAPKSRYVTTASGWLHRGESGPARALVAPRV